MTSRRPAGPRSAPLTRPPRRTFRSPGGGRGEQCPALGPSPHHAGCWFRQLRWCPGGRQDHAVRVPGRPVARPQGPCWCPRPVSTPVPVPRFRCRRSGVLAPAGNNPVSSTATGIGSGASGASPGPGPHAWPGRPSRPCGRRPGGPRRPRPGGRGPGRPQVFRQCPWRPRVPGVFRFRLPCCPAAPARGNMHPLRPAASVAGRGGPRRMPWRPRCRGSHPARRRWPGPVRLSAAVWSVPAGPPAVAGAGPFAGALGLSAPLSPCSVRGLQRGALTRFSFGAFFDIGGPSPASRASVTTSADEVEEQRRQDFTTCIRRLSSAVQIRHRATAR